VVEAVAALVGEAQVLVVLVVVLEEIAKAELLAAVLELLVKVITVVEQTTTMLLVVEVSRALVALDLQVVLLVMAAAEAVAE
jgi:hypothetical protein